MQKDLNMSYTMNFMFWNIHRNNLLFPVIIELIDEYNLDVFILAEFPIDSQWKLTLPPTHIFHSLANEKSKIKYIYNKRLIIKSLGDAPQMRGSMLSVTLNDVISFNLVGCHLVDPYNYDKIEQENRAGDFSEFVYNIEQKTNNNQTVVVGDFNMNPFDPGMARAKCFNSVMDKRIAQQGKRRYCDKDYPFFYNPMWYFLGHPNHLNGTIYYNHSEDLQYYWHIFDQVLIRPSLIDKFLMDSLKIIEKTPSTNLLTERGTVNHNISDHLPIFFTLKF